jgi:putative ABC transport system permease protein
MNQPTSATASASASAGAATVSAARATVSPPPVWRMAWRQLQRDFRAGELRLILLAVALAVAALSAVGFLADRLQSSLARDARTLLGGDAVVASDQPLPADFADTARRMGLATAWTATFPSMARHRRICPPAWWR